MTTFLRGREGACVAALAALAALRVFLLAAAFPLFSNIDEHRHIDAVLKYARGYLPAPDNTAYEPEMGRYLGLYGSPEFLLPPPGAGTRPPPPPPWRRAPEAMLRSVERGEEFFARRTNLEAMQPPAYYALAGLWLRLGQLLGLEGAELLYWVRGLGTLLAAALVIVSYGFLREIYPDELLVRVGVPALLSVFPVDLFSYVTRDALSPLVAGIGFFLALRLVEPRQPGACRIHAVVAVVAACAFLAKYTNAVLLAAIALCSGLALRARPEARRLRGQGGCLLGMWAFITAACGAWLVRNLLVFGDLTGTAYKIERMGWSRKPLDQYLDHPLFSLSGAATFLRELIPLFWRGELAWHRVPLASPLADGVYTVTTVLFLSLAAWGLARRTRPPTARRAEGVAFFLVLGSVALLAALSLPYVFHEHSNPSAQLPYFVQGRLISGVLVPFALLYVRGISVAASRLPTPRARASAGWACLGAVGLVAVVSEVGLHWSVFASEYNLFHLP